MDLFKFKNVSSGSVSYIQICGGAYLVYLGGKMLLDIYHGASENHVLSLLIGLTFVCFGIYFLIRQWCIYRKSQETPANSIEDELGESNEIQPDLCDETNPATADMEDISQ